MAKKICDNAKGLRFSQKSKAIFSPKKKSKIGFSFILVVSDVFVEFPARVAQCTAPGQGDSELYSVRLLDIWFSTPLRRGHTIRLLDAAYIDARVC